MRKITLAIVLSACFLAASAAIAEPPEERTVVVAIADADQPRVLVRWRIVAGVARYEHYFVYRRTADEDEFIQLNGDPIGPLPDAASIAAVFEVPGREDALAWVIDSLGGDYSHDLLYMQQPGAPQTERAKLAFLPDQNYGAALALGLGWLDEAVVLGETYVYEVWGADELGYPAERLGRASALAGSPQALSGPQELRCTDLGDQRAHLAVHLRWQDPDADEYFFGYEVFRAPRNSDGTCPEMGPGLPNTVNASRYPVVSGSVSGAAEGHGLFTANCASCHNAMSPRDAPAPSGVRGGTLEGFRIRQYDEVPGLADYPHATTELDALGPETLASIFRWIQDVRFRDDGSTTPASPVEPDRWYCYRTYARDLLGQLSAPQEVQCQVRDMLPPEVPALIRSERVDRGGYETCEISWQRNDETVDGTAFYQVLRRQGQVPRDEHLVVPSSTTGLAATIPQPSGGERVTFSDETLGSVHAKQRFFYAARAIDGSGNTSPISGWVPCVPRDIVAPQPPLISLTGCCTGGGNCTDRRDDPDWQSAGAAGMIFADPRDCPPRVEFDLDPDAFRVRVFRSYDGVNYFAGEDIEGPTFSPQFLPMLDQKITYRFKAFDKSGNLSSFSDAFEYVAFGGHGPPPPQIVEVVGTPTPSATGLVIMRFRAVKPDVLLGFSLYKHHFDPESVHVFLDKGTLVTRYHDANLTTSVPDAANEPDQWGVLPGAETLDELLPEDAPAGDDPYLIYKPTENLYEMRVDLGDVGNLLLQLRAIGWSGLEGGHATYNWGGWQTGDLELTWPSFFPDNLGLFEPGSSELDATPESGYVRVRWDTAPGGCQSAAGGTFKPFVVFRRRGTSPNWKQISPLFNCSDASSTSEEYYDTDVEDGFYYTYFVIQLDRMGEFEHRRGPETVCYPNPAACSGPVPD